MNLFRGRTEVFPKKWDNSKTGKSGYSPTCSNEWIEGTCNKPRIKCSDCPNQAFIALTGEIIRKHLGGEDFNGSKREYTQCLLTIHVGFWQLIWIKTNGNAMLLHL